MAISPQELEKILEEEVLSMEQIIDSRLKDNKIYKGETIDIAAPDRMTHNHFKILHKKYKSAGWSKIEWQGDQKNGDYLKFTHS